KPLRTALAGEHTTSQRLVAFDQLGARSPLGRGCRRICFSPARKRSLDAARMYPQAKSHLDRGNQLLGFQLRLLSSKVSRKSTISSDTLWAPRGPGRWESRPSRPAL